MRVGIDLCALWTTHRTRGIGVYCENLVSALGALDQTNEYVLFIAAQLSDPLLRELPFNFRAHVLGTAPSTRAAPLWSHQWQLPRAARRLELDVLHCPAVTHHASLPSVPFWQTVPTIVTVHDVAPLVLGKTLLSTARYRWFYRFQLAACRRAVQLIAVSEHTAQELVRFGLARRDRISVIHNGTPRAKAAPSPISPRVRELASQPFLLHVGGADPHKNQAMVLRAFGELSRDPEFEHALVLVGQHHLDDARASDISPRAAGRIARLGEITRDELQFLYENCSVFLFPSLYEGFGLPILEAMQAGAPVITSDHSSLAEVAGNAALLIDPRDPRALADAVRQLLCNPALCERYRAAGRLRAREFTWARAAEQTRRVYERVTCSRA